MSPLYIVIAVIVGLAAYLLFTGRRRPVDDTPVRRTPARRKDSAAKPAKQRRRATEDEEDDVKPRPEESPNARPASNPSPDDAKPEEAGADGALCPCGSGKPFSQCHGVEEPEEPRPQPRPQPSPRKENRSFRYFGKTVLLYEPSHGNQIEYYDENGKSYLWYPGNRSILAGEWRLEGDKIYSRYGVPTYNPVTGQREIAGAWSSCPIIQMLITEVDVAYGDVLDLASGYLPYFLQAHPRLRSLQAAERERGDP